jgi:hypothetical protein
MIYLIFLITTLVLLGGFFILTWYETSHGVRFFATSRVRLDQVVARVAFIRTHVDVKAFLKEELRRLANRTGHLTVKQSLKLVRGVERLLTRLVRYFRSQEIAQVSQESVRPFVRTLADFKEGLKTPQPEAIEVRS